MPDASTTGPNPSLPSLTLELPMKLLSMLSLLTSALVCGSIGFFPNRAQAAADRFTIEVWTRGSGAYADIENPPKLKSKTLDVDQLVNAKLFDVQYQKEYEYRGSFLHEIIQRYEPARPSDMILLHFDNKMIVPLPLSIVKQGAFEMFLARMIKDGGKFVSDFPKIAKPSDRWRDPRPLVFNGNKLVVSKAWHPGLKKLTPEGFLPWKSAGSLVGIEWIDSQSYRGQFAFDPKPEVIRGQTVYMERCVFCHAVRQVGGRLGWDFVDPLPIFQKRTEQTLHSHVKYPKLDALERGLMMPTQPDFTDEDAAALWYWMRAAATHPLKKYE